MINLCKKIIAKTGTPEKQFALILKPNPCYTIMILKYAMISIVEKQHKQIELKTQQSKIQHPKKDGVNNQPHHSSLINLD